MFIDVAPDWVALSQIMKDDNGSPVVMVVLAL
jgi:hypothetical protein